MLETFDRLLGWASTALMWIACAIIPCMFTMITVDVSIRTFGYSPPLFTSSVVEYALLYLAMCSAPWLVRERGHVAIEALLSVTPDAVRRPLARVVYAVSAALCFLFTYLCGRLFVLYWLGGELDIRGIDIPYWLQFLPLPVCFALAGLEFCMFLAGIRSYYTYDLGEVKDSV